MLKLLLQAHTGFLLLAATLIALGVLTPLHPAFAQNSPFQVTITSPVPGQALQGAVPIYGSSNQPRFQNAELSFGYAIDTTDTWFLIQRSPSPVIEGILAQWDTTTITDGNYNLKLTVNLTNGEKVEYIVEGLRVRNYTPIETDTPTPIPASETPLPGSLLQASPTDTLVPSLTPVPSSPTPLPTNPAEISEQQLSASIGAGVAAAAGALLLIGIYSTIHHLTHR
ncbi:MAG: hypothetical protein JW726_18480 [Anaerolineales bacterium]|nr:hypothetical protein [Anaerolineales bacterium]